MKFNNDERWIPIGVFRFRWAARMLARAGLWIADRRGYTDGREFWVEEL